MGGMKSGSGDDPFSETDRERPVEEAPIEDEQSAPGDDASGGATSSAEDAASASSQSERSTNDVLPGIPDHPADQAHPLPWIHRRDGVKDGRSHKTIHYTEHTLKRERRELIGALEDEVADDVELTDAREAAYLVGMGHVDEIAEILREWGYGIE